MESNRSVQVVQEMQGSLVARVAWCVSETKFFFPAEIKVARSGCCVSQPQKDSRLH